MGMPLLVSWPHSCTQLAVHSCALLLCHTAAALLTVSSGLALTEGVLQALLCVAKQDPDAVWTVLHLLLGSQHLNSMTNPHAELFSDASKLLQMQETVNSSGDVANLRLSVSGLLQEVETMQASWHSHCQVDFEITEQRSQNDVVGVKKQQAVKGVLTA